MHTCQVQGMILHNILVLEKKRGEEITHLDKTAGDNAAHKVYTCRLIGIPAGWRLCYRKRFDYHCLQARMQKGVSTKLALIH